MPEQAHNKAEEALRRYSRERREKAADVAMHPATRRLLQSEVARQFGAARKSDRRPWFPWLGTWRLAAVSCAIVAALGAGIWMFTDRGGEPLQRSMDVARTTTSEERSLNAHAEAPLPQVRSKAEVGEINRVLREINVSGPNSVASGPAASGAKAASNVSSEPYTDSVPQRLAEVKRTRKTEPAPSAPTRAEPEPRSGAENADTAKLLAAKDADFAKQSAHSAAQLGQTALAKEVAAERAAEPSSIAPVQNTTQQAIGGESRLGAAVAANTPPPPTTGARSETYFRQPSGAAAGNDSARNATTAGETAASRDVPVATQIAGRSSASASAAPSNVLVRFNFQQRGDAVLLTDADGSVYEGKFLTVLFDSPGAAGGGATERNGPLGAPAAPRATQRVFRAVGTNLTLKQRVEVQGRISELTNLPALLPFVEVTESAKLMERKIAAQVVPGTPVVPLASPSVARATAGSASVTNDIPVLEGTWRVGATEKAFKAVPATR